LKTEDGALKACASGVWRRRAKIAGAHI
jgi:hypothetical protein